ncbi:MAG TPA: T9SS type A sorting domain-containing protein, partial [Bacteroidia bacterium]|nr:T9SS type A sorting domain-containing protein [Bacteroidia bacterium]
NRNYTDTMQNDIAFVYDAPSMLTNYQAEPWEQYLPGDLRTTPMPIFIRNNNASKNISSLNIINATYTYNINTTPSVTTYSSGANNIDPYVDAGYDNDPLQAQPALTTSNFPATLGSATTYTITHVLQRSSDFDLWNDTLRYNQVFNNYYAYDNGTPDYAYYINPIPGVPTYLAYQFSLNNPDTIFGMQIYFDYVFINASPYTFKLIVWNDKGGAPGDTIYVDDTILNPVYPKDGNDMFTTFKFRKPKAIGAGKFYVGWEQTTGDSMNVGFEFNDNHQNQIFYSIDPYAKPVVWNYSSFKGSLLIRPLVGSPKGPASVNAIDAPKNDIMLYPNPSNGKFTIQIDNGQLTMDNEKMQVSVYNVVGERILSQSSIVNSQLSIDLGDVPNGFYLVQITSDKGDSSFKKLLISK